MKTISIVMAYYNRLELLKNTLFSLTQFTIPNEIIIVDDASDIPLSNEDISEYNLPIKILNIEKSDKWWSNPCMPFNIGFIHVTSDITIIQNPECFHAYDIVGHSLKNLNDKEYISYACYSLAKNENPSIHYNQLNNASVRYDGDSGWYNHSFYRPKAYHFTSAINTQDLIDLDGFDDRFANRIAYDDDAFIYKISKKLSVRIVDEVYSLHQNHYEPKDLSLEERTELIRKQELNRNLLNVIRNENG